LGAVTGACLATIVRSERIGMEGSGGSFNAVLSLPLARASRASPHYILKNT
jgi:hypothetical protein